MDDVEFKILAGVIPSQPSRMEKAQLRLISEDNFENPAFREMWRLLDAYYDDHMAVMPEWYIKNRAEQLGYDAAKALSLTELYKFLADQDVVEHEFDAALNLVKDDEMSRKTAEAIVTAREILQGEFYNESTDSVLKGQDAARSYLSEALQDLEALGSESAPEGAVHDDLEKLWQSYLLKESNPEEASGIKYGIEDLDEATGGIRPGELVLVAAFTGAGKSHLMSSLAWSAMREGKNVLMFTTETTREEMEIRILARHSRLPQFKTPGGIDSREITFGTLSAEHRDVFRNVLEDFKQQAGNLFMVQMPTHGHVDYVYAKANQYNRHAPIDLIIIDSINLLRYNRKYQSKREMLEDLLQDFKRFASAFDQGRGVAIASPWQMSRAAWQEAIEAGGVYSLSSLADTSEAEKAQPLTAKIATPDGWVTMGDVQEGMQILGYTSEPQTIKEIHKFSPRKIYELETMDGGITECSPSHLWHVSYSSDVDDFHNQTTEEVIESLRQGKEVYLPCMSYAAEYSVLPHKGKELLDPMYMASLISETNVTQGNMTLTTGDVDNLNRHISTLPMYGLTTTTGTEAPSFVFSEENLKEDPMYRLLNEANLFSGDPNSFKIPESYLYAHSSIRAQFLITLAALRMDEDSPRDTLEDLVKFLPFDHPGYGDTLKQMVWSMGWTADGMIRQIKSIRDTGRVEPVQCITVSNEDSLYVTDDFIVTHNSPSQIIAMFKGDHMGEPGRVYLQLLKNRGGLEMTKRSCPIDYRNSYIGGSGDASTSSSGGDTSKTAMVRDIGNLLSGM